MKLRSLRTKLLLGTLLVIAFVMTAVMVVVDHRQRAAIIAEVQRRGEVIARNLAAISYGPLLLYNYTALEQNVARVAGEADVVYALVLDADGRVAAHSSHPERVGAVLEVQRCNIQGLERLRPFQMSGDLLAVDHDH